MTLVSELGDRKDTKQAESEENGSESQVHELGNIVNNLIEEVREFFTAHQRHCKYEADGGGQDGIRCEDDAHADLWLVALLIDFRLAG